MSEEGKTNARRRQSAATFSMVTSAMAPETTECGRGGLPGRENGAPDVRPAPRHTVLGRPDMPAYRDFLRPRLVARAAGHAPRRPSGQTPRVPPMGRPAVELHVVSDATGETAARLVQALEAQFPEQEFTEIRHPRVETVADLQLAVDRMKGRPAVVVYTLVEPELREQMRLLCRRARLHYCDLLGHPIEAVATVSGQAARMTPRARPPLNDAYFRRMSAIEFAVKHDDGIGGGLHDADIVLVGVSRTSKTPLSIYLGYLGYRAANVPLVKGIEPPAELFRLDRWKIVGLSIDATRLAEIRGERMRWMKADRRYADLAEIYDELEYATQVQRRLNCPVLEVSELSIEEISHRIIELVERRRAEAPA